MSGEGTSEVGLSEHDAEMTRHHTGFETETTPEKKRAQVDLLFEDLQERYTGREKHEKSGVLKDIQALVNADKDEILDNGDPDHPKTANKRLTDLSVMGKTLEKMLAREPVDDDLYRDLGEYLAEKAKEDENAGGKNQAAFSTFLQHIPSQFLPEEYQTFESSETERPEATAQTETLADRIENVPDIDRELKMDHANAALEDMRESKLKKFKKIVKYFQAHESDVDAFLQTAGETNPNWVKYLPAMSKAVQIWKTNNRKEDDVKLVVTPKSDGEFDVKPYDGTPLQAEEEGKPFIIDPQNEKDIKILQDSIAFVYYKDVVKTALEAITLLNKPDFISREQQFAVGQMLKIHSNNLAIHEPDRFVQDDPVIERIAGRINGVLFSLQLE